ncbi:hypothetical protein TARUN_8208 [Trichoderma arundinaceum]|uniref:Histone chaperone domain-containing protein n=1 Tax=Trichoderma arundinaceum TaxID=490622 RepID=A0A395ND51_TRIAR|nr:hypothetical protein TARUN_8208 [Trichoderma arundinaceum]
MSKFSYDKETDVTSVPEGQVHDDSYVTDQKYQSIPVQRDNARVEDPIEASSADTDEQLNKDDEEAIDQSNIVDERTRGSKPRGSYQEPGDLKLDE